MSISNSGRAYELLFNWVILVLAMIATFEAKAQTEEINLPQGTLLYSGLTDQGWQVFSFSLPEGPQKQLTFSPGDKKMPMLLADRQTVVCRDSQGALLAVPLSAADARERIFARGTTAWADFSFLPGEQSIIVARLASNTRRRQFLYEFDRASGKETPFRQPAKGSFGYVKVSPDGRRIAVTYLQVFAEERLALLGPKPDEAGDALQFLTPPGTIVKDPCWSADGQLLYFVEQDRVDEPMHLGVASLPEGTVSAVEADTKSSCASPFPTADGKGLFFVATGKGQSRLRYLDLCRHRSRELSLSGQHRDPFFIAAP